MLTSSQLYAWSRHLLYIALQAGIYWENKEFTGNGTPANSQSFFSILLVYGLMYIYIYIYIYLISWWWPNLAKASLGSHIEQINFPPPVEPTS